MPRQLFDIYTALSYLSFESQEKETRKVDIKEVLQKSVGYYQELSESKNIRLNLEVDAYEVEIDEAKLSMLFGNLISNAIKYSHPASEIDISFKNKLLSVRDYGIGIPKEKLSKIYEQYNRETEYAGGFGIGLSIVKKISQEYGLKLEVNSSLGKGTCFEITFL
jgi:two-component system OmpR family sensor kinase